jgi:hypothetical protein
MALDSEFQTDLNRICDLLRSAGLSEDKIEAFSQQKLQQVSVTELSQVTKALGALEGRIGDSHGPAKDVVDEATRLMGRIRQILERPEMADVVAERPAPTDGGTKYPNIKVRLRDLGDDLGPILRRVSYAMADAGVDDAEIEQYKREVKQDDNPVAVAKRWVTVE